MPFDFKFVAVFGGVVLDGFSHRCFRIIEELVLERVGQQGADDQGLPSFAPRMSSTFQCPPSRTKS